MEISKKLSAYIEYKFLRMIKGSNDLKEERKDYRKRQPTINKRRIREQNRHLEALSKIRGYIDMDKDTYQLIENKIKLKHKSILKKEGNSRQNPLKSKATLDLNNFIYTCYYLIRKQFPEVETEIYKWIEEYLKNKNYKMQDENFYDADAIKGRINNFKKSNHHVNSIIDDSYNRK
jgi:hypothetical protein